VLAARLLAAPLILLGLSGLVVSVPTAYLIQSFMPTGLNSLIVGHAFGLDQRLIATSILWGSAVVLLIGLGLGLT
jgi:predicted permease